MKSPIIRGILSAIVRKIIKGVTHAFGWIDSEGWVDSEGWEDGLGDFGMAPPTPPFCGELPDSDEEIPFDIAGDGQLYLRGSHNAWITEEQYRLKYKGNNIYQVVALLSGAMEFKIASSDGEFAVQVWAQNSEGVGIEMQDLILDNPYDVAYLNGGVNNNQVTLAEGYYSFLLELNEPNPAQGFSVGTLTIHNCDQV